MIDRDCFSANVVVFRENTAINVVCVNRICLRADIAFVSFILHVKYNDPSIAG